VCTEYLTSMLLHFLSFHLFFSFQKLNAFHDLLLTTLLFLNEKVVLKVPTFLYFRVNFTFKLEFLLAD
jgi:hypothetical protein